MTELNDFIIVSFPFREVRHLEVTLKCDKPSPEDLAKIIRESKVLSGGYYTRMYVKTKTGDLLIAKDWKGGTLIWFPLNENKYKLTFSKDVDKKNAEWICKEWEHFSWADIHYSSPAEYAGNDPQTLDELCVYYRRLRRTNHWDQEVKNKVAQLFLDLIFEEATIFAQKLNMPFHTLHLFSSRSRTTIASTNCEGLITFNAHRLHQDADSIRFEIVHELCHSVSGGHGRDFNKAMEEAMLFLGLITRPCAFSNKLCNWNGVRFPTGNYCPGYDFEDRDSEDTPEQPFMDKTSLWKRNGQML